MAIPFRSDAISGSLQRLTDGTSYLAEGTNISITSGSSGQITIEAIGAAGDITSVTAGAGLEGGGATGAVTLGITSDVATLTGSNTFVPNSDSTTVFQVKNAAESATALNIDTTNMRTGIGVADPDTTLEVLSTTTQQKWSYDADSYATITVDDGGGTVIATSEAGNLVLNSEDISFAAAGGQVYFQNPSGSNRFIVDVNASTTYLTNIQDADLVFRVGTAQTEVFRIDQSEDSVLLATDSKIQFRDTATSISSTAANTLQVVAPNFGITGSLHISSSAEGDANPLLRIDHENATGTKPIFFVSGSGLVAIGTDSPRTDSSDTNRLHILGEGGADQGQDPVANALLMLENDDHAGIQFMTPSTKSGFLCWGDAAAARVSHLYYSHATSRFHFDGANYGDEVMTIRSTGDAVNIGSLNSANMLTSDASLHISSSTEGEETGGPVLLKIDHENASNILFVTGSGRVGIGTSAPARDLDVKDDTDASAVFGRAFVGYNSSRADAANFAHRDHVSDSAYALQQRDDGDTIVNAPAGRSVGLRINGNNAVTVAGAANNNVGFGNLGTPTARVHITGSTSEKDLLRVDGDQEAQHNTLYVSGSGRVGIGTGSPTHMLHISSSAESEDTDLFIIHGYNSNDPAFEVKDVSGVNYVGINTAAGTYPLSVNLGGGNSRFTNGNILWTQNELGIKLGTIGSANSTSQSITAISSSIKTDSGILIQAGKSGPDEGHGVIVSGSSESRTFRIKSHAVDNIMTADGSGLVMFNSGTNSSASDPDESAYPDINFFVSGSVGSAGSATPGTALFGGDLVTSGTFFTENSVVRKPFRHILESTGSIMSLSQTSTHFFSMDTDAEMTPGYLNYAYELGVENGIYDGQEITIIYTGTLRPADNYQAISPNFWSAPTGGDFVNQVRVGFPGATASLVLAWATFDPAVINGKTLGLIDSSAVKYNFTGSNSTAIGSPTYSASGKSVTFGVQSAGSMNDVAQGLYNGLALAQSNGAAFGQVSSTTDGSGLNYVYQSALGTVGNTAVDGTLISAGALHANAGANAFTGGAIPPNADNVNFYGADTAGNVYINNKSPALKMVWDASSSKWEVISSNNTSA